MRVYRNLTCAMSSRDLRPSTQPLRAGGRFNKYLFLLLAMLMAPTFSIAATQAPDLKTTEAGQAFLAKDYETALAGFEVLAEQYPHDLNLQRYIAISLGSLGRVSEAIDILIRLTAMSPDPVPAHYHLGVLYYRIKDIDSAQFHFNEVVLGEREAKYAKLALSYLDAIAKQRFATSNPGEPKRWNFYSSIGYSQDTSDTDQRARLGAYLSGGYYFLRTPQWTGQLDASWYRADSISGSQEHTATPGTGGVDRLDQWSLGVNLQNQATALSKAVISTLNLGASQLDLGGQAYKSSVYYQLGSRLQFLPNHAMRWYLSGGKDQFDETQGINPDFSLSSAKRTTAGVDYRVYINDRQTELSVGLFRQFYTSDNDSQNRTSNGLNALARFTLPHKFRLNLSASLEDGEYDKFEGVVPRMSTTKTFKVSLSRRFGSNIISDLSYRVSDVEISDLPDGQSRNVVSLRIAYIY